METKSGQTTDIQGVSITCTEADDDDVPGQSGQPSSSPRAARPENLQDKIYSREQTSSAIDHSDVERENTSDRECEMEVYVTFQQEVKEDNSFSDESASVCQSDSGNCTLKYEVLKGDDKKGTVPLLDQSDSATDPQHAADVISERYQSVGLEIAANNQASLGRKHTASKRMKMHKRKLRQNTSPKKDRSSVMLEQDGSTLEVLQVNTASMSAWALQVLHQAKSYLQQQQRQQKQQHKPPCQEKQQKQQQRNHQQKEQDAATAYLSAEVRFAVEILSSSQWQPCVIKTEDLNPVHSSGGQSRVKQAKTDHLKRLVPISPHRDGMDTDLEDAINKIEDIVDNSENNGNMDKAVNLWDDDWLSPTVFLKNNGGVNHAGSAEDDQTLATIADSGEPAHVLQKGTLVKFICRLCKKECSSRAILKRHMIEMHSQHKSSLQYKCKLCGSTYKRKYRLVKHMRSHTRERSVECTECGANFRCRSHMKKHYRQKHCGGKYLCKVCGQYFESIRGLQHHMSTHNETQPTIMCNQLSIYPGPLFTKEKKINVKEKEQVCSDTPSTTLTQYTNSVHSQGKTSSSVVNCQVCGEGFKSDQLLQKHMGYHTGTRPFLCSECNLAFSRKDYYNIHLRNHRLNKTFDCHVCGVGMKTEKHLEMHMGFHTGDRPYQCSVCWLAFAKKDRLDTHEQSHNLERVRFPCPTCGESFCTKALLKYHCVLRHNAETPHVCNTCGERFDRKCRLQRHMKGPCSGLQAQIEAPTVQAWMDNYQN